MAGNWELFAPHRRRVTDLIAANAPSPPGRLHVLGAGNCHDLVLPELTAAFREVRLIDLDSEALERGQRQQGARSPALIAHGSVDITGMAPALVAWADASPTPAEVRAALDPLPVPEVGLSLSSAHVVVSATVLTQLIESAVAALGADHPSLLDVILAMRAVHLRLMIDLLTPGGVGILVTDVVSSTTCPGLEDLPPRALPRRLAQLVAARNFFTGANPFAIRAILSTDPALAPRIERVAAEDPWLWQTGEDTWRLVSALLFRKRR